MESGPAIFTAVTFALFGGALLAWTGARVLHGRPVADGVERNSAAIVAVLAGVLALAAAGYCLTCL